MGAVGAKRAERYSTAEDGDQQGKGITCTGQLAGSRLLRLWTVGARQ